MCSRQIEIAIQERALALKKCQQLVAQMAHHREYLEACLRTLVGEYRAANTANRKSASPAYFAHQPTLATSLPTCGEPNTGGVDPTQSITGAQKDLMTAHSATIEAFDTVRSLTDKEAKGGS
jgi:hypothetical protein